jgi:transcriptional regulator with XRE-family HTH domain
LKALVGKQVKRFRVQKNLTQQELADKLEVDRQYIWKIENAKVNITLDYLEKVIRCLGCTHSEFFSFNS